MRPPATWSLGTVIGGRYRLETLLGAGGFGAVFRATDQAGHGQVAVKILSRSAMLHADSVARFYREARLAMTLRHPNTVRMLDLGDAGEGTPFIAFDLLEGVSLEQRLATGAPMTVSEAIAVAIELLGSLEEAHASHVIHRDVKPANVFLCRNPAGAIKLLDFGVAQETPPGAAMEKLTREGTMIGTPAYMAPEQLAGKPAAPGTDFFALALVLAEMITAAPVYHGDPLGICMSKLNGYPPPFSAGAIPPALLAVLKCATAYEIAHRYASAEQMRNALQATGAGTARSSLAPQPLSGRFDSCQPASLVGAPTSDLPGLRPASWTPSTRFGTQVIDRPSAPPQRSVSAMAATAPPSINTPLAANTGASRGLRGTAPLMTGVPSQHASVLAATAPPSIANPMAATAPDRPKSGKHALLAATVNDPDAASSLSGTLSMDSAPRVSVPVAPMRPKKRSFPWAIVASITLVLLAGAFATVWYLRGRCVP